MKKEISKIAKPISAIIPKVALMVGISTLGEACFSVYYQPKLPAELDQYRK